MEADRLLHTFRITAGLPSYANPLGGWEAPHVELRGHTIGHYLSACSFMYANTGDEKLKQKAEYIVHELANCQNALNRQGYLSAFPEEFFDRLEAGKRVWCPWYTIHKILAGLLDVYQYCGTKKALTIANKMAHWVKHRTDKLSPIHMQQTLEMEFGGMGEVLANLYAISGNPDHLKIAKRFDHQRILNPLANQFDRLKSLHANTQIPKMIAAARLYELTGEDYYRDVANFSWNQITNARSFATGGTSNYEHWRTDPYILSSEISVESQECCCTYNMLKLTNHLFQWNPNAMYMDYYEQALYNGILATQDPTTGMMMYYVALKPGHFKVFNTPNNSFWCCTGTGLESHSKYAESIYAYDDDGIYVNLFIPSEVFWQEKGVRIRQKTDFPQVSKSLLTVKTDQPVDMAMRIRIPKWIQGNPSVKINGEAQPIQNITSRYLNISRTWLNSDTIEISLPMGLHLSRMPDNPNLAAIMYGPLVLAGKLGNKKLTKDMEYIKDQRAQHEAPSIHVHELSVDGEPVNQWIEQISDKPLKFKTKNVGRPRDIELVPFHTLFHERYNIYWQLNS